MSSLVSLIEVQLLLCGSGINADFSALSRITHLQSLVLVSPGSTMIGQACEKLRQLTKLDLKMGLKIEEYWRPVHFDLNWQSLQQLQQVTLCCLICTLGHKFPAIMEVPYLEQLNLANALLFDDSSQSSLAALSEQIRAC